MYTTKYTQLISGNSDGTKYYSYTIAMVCGKDLGRQEGELKIVSVATVTFNL